MGLKTKLLASAAMMVGLGLAATDVAQAGGVYGTFSGGLNFSDDPAVVHTATENIDVHSETGFVVSVAVGWHLDDIIAQGLRVELEGAYRHNNGNLGSFTEATSGGSSSAVSTDLTTWSVMGNVWYDFNLSSRLRPYIGGGAGWVRNKVVPTFCACRPIENEGFGWQAGAGLNFVVSENSSIGVGYRYMDAGDQGETFGGNSLGEQNHGSVLFQLNYNLN